MIIRPFDPRTAADDECAAVAVLDNRIRAERLPDDPPIPTEESIRAWRSIPEVVEVFAWLVRAPKESQVVGAGSVRFLQTPENRHMVWFDINVLPESRRRGIARRLLARIVEVPQREGRRLMLATTRSAIPAGEEFMRRIGAQLALVQHSQQIDLRDVDRDQLRRWQERARERAADFELGLWEDELPEAEIEEIARMYEAMNRAPRGALELEDFHWTPAHIRQFEATERARGTEWWTMYVRERGSRRIAGFTDVAWNPNRPEILQQQGTGVFPEYQNRGLGRWLKAAMLAKVLRDRPQVKYVRTVNADQNAPMLRINQELGFKPFQSRNDWQVETDTVLAYLRDRLVAPGAREEYV